MTQLRASGAATRLQVILAEHQPQDKLAWALR
jgi:hypothetical protein